MVCRISVGDAPDQAEEIGDSMSSFFERSTLVMFILLFILIGCDRTPTTLPSKAAPAVRNFRTTTFPNDPKLGTLVADDNVLPRIAVYSLDGGLAPLRIIVVAYDSGEVFFDSSVIGVGPSRLMELKVDQDQVRFAAVSVAESIRRHDCDAAFHSREHTWGTVSVKIDSKNLGFSAARILSTPNAQQVYGESAISADRCFDEIEAYVSLWIKAQAEQVQTSASKTSRLGANPDRKPGR